MILSLGSRDNLGNKQTKLRHNYLIKNERYVVITPHRQETGYTRSKKKQTRKKAIKTKQNQIIKRRFFKSPNAVSESDSTTIQETQDLKDSIDNNYPINKQKHFFSESESTTLSSIKGNRRLKIHTFLNRYDHSIGISKKTH